MSLLSRYVTRNIHGFYRVGLCVLPASNSASNRKRNQGGLWCTQRQRAVSTSTLNVVAPVTNATKRGRSTPRIVSTLNPARLCLQDVHDISGISHVSFRLPSEHYRDPPRPTYFAYASHVNPKRRIPFPEGTRGFLYFHRSEYPHAAAGQIRFRVIRTEDSHLPAAQSFSRGSDLLQTNHFTPWHVHLLQAGPTFPAIRESLVMENLVTQTQMAEIRRLTAGLSRPSQRRILDDIRAPFLINMGTCHTRLHILHQEGLFWGAVRFYFCTPAAQAKARHIPSGSRSGRALVRFEVSDIPLPHPSDTERRIHVVLRVLKIIESPKPEDEELAGHIFKEGELVQMYDLKERTTVGPWFYNPSHNSCVTPSSMKVLEETYL